MKLISWNVNGLRAVITKGFKDFFEEINYLRGEGFGVYGFFYADY